MQACLEAHDVWIESKTRSTDDGKTSAWVETATSEALPRQQWYAAAFDAFSRQASLPDNFNGRGAAAPSQLALQRAQRALEIAEWFFLDPLSIKALAVGGMGLLFGPSKRWAGLECYNDGEVGVTLQDRLNGDLESWTVLEARDDPHALGQLLRDTFRRIERYLRGDGDGDG